MDQDKTLQKFRQQSRSIERAEAHDEDLGPFELLPGTWSNLPGLPGRGWNMIALPFASQPASPFNFRLLLNQYNETLKFTTVDKAVPNRGIRAGAVPVDSDQFVSALDYEQSIVQLVADDAPVSGKAGAPGAAIHHEPGLLLNMVNETTDGLDIARLSTIPHGNAVLALGRSGRAAGPPSIPAIQGLPVGVEPDLAAPYLAPYKHFHDNPFEGIFDPVDPTALLRAANAGVAIKRTTTLTFDTTLQDGGIVNIPFIKRQADSSEMKATFWIQELEELDGEGRPKLRLQYAQVVMLDFFPRRDGLPGLIRWPHVSINTLEKLPST